MDLPKSRGKIVEADTAQIEYYIARMEELSPNFVGCIPFDLHLSNLKSALSNNLKRLYHSLTPLTNTCDKQIPDFVFADNMFDVERTSIRTSTKRKSLFLSLDDRLDLILFHICGVSPEKVRDAFENYEDVSMACLNCAVHKYLPSFNISNFLGIDTRLDAYIYRLLSSVPVTDPNRTSKLVYSFYYDILYVATLYLNIIVDNLIEDYNIAIRSQRFASYTLGFTGRTKEVPDTITINFEKAALHADATLEDYSVELDLVFCDSSGYLGHLKNKYTTSVCTV